MNRQLAKLLALLVSVPAAAMPTQTPIAAGAQALPDTQYLSARPSSVLHVATWGSDSNPGTEQRPLRTINRAAQLLTPGQAAYVHAGTYDEHVRIESRDGTASAPIFLMGAPGEARPVVRKTRNEPAFRIARSYWVVEGFEIHGNGRQAHAANMKRVHHVTLRNVYAHDGIGPAAVAVYDGSSDILLEGNTIARYTWTVSGKRRDSHAFLILPDAKRVLVKRNVAYGQSGDGIQCQGVSEAGFGTHDPYDLTIEDNRFYQNVENAVDIKSCSRVTVRGGSGGGNKFFGYRTTDDTTSSCSGAAVVIHYNARKILVENSRFWDSGIGIAVGRDDRQVSDLVIRRNIFFNMTTDRRGCGDGVRIGKARNVQIYNNTFDNIPRSAIRVGVDAYNTLSEDVRVWNNIVRNATNGLDISTSRAPRFLSDRNIFWRSSGATYLRKDSAQLNLTAWTAQTRQDPTSREADPQFINDPLNNDYFTLPTSPARDNALDPQGERVCGARSDLGFLESCN